MQPGSISCYPRTWCHHSAQPWPSPSASLRMRRPRPSQGPPLIRACRQAGRQGSKRQGIALKCGKMRQLLPAIDVSHNQGRPAYVYSLQRRTLQDAAGACLLGASRRQVATTPPSPTAAKRSPLGAKRTAAALPQFASLRQTAQTACKHAVNKCLGSRRVRG